MLNDIYLDMHLRDLIMDIKITYGKEFIFPLTIHEIHDNISGEYN